MRQEVLWQQREPADRPPQRMVLSTSYHVFPLFARGCLVAEPPVDVSEHANQDVLLDLVECEAPVPANWIRALESAGRSAIPVLLELKPGAAVSRIDTPHGMVRGLALSDVKAILFRSSDELRRFRSWPFEDIDLDQADVEWGSAPDLFAGVDRPDPEPRAWGGAHVDLMSLHAQLRRVDMYLGALAFAVRSIDQDVQTVRVIEHLLNLRAHHQDFAGLPARLAGLVLVTSDLLDTLPNEATADDVEPLDLVTRCVLLATVRVLADHPTKSGWPSMEVLDSIRSESDRLVRELGNEEERARLTSWHQSCLAAIRDSEPYPLTDEGNIVLRAVLVLLLRGTLENVLLAGDSAEPREIGPRVQKIASDLAAIRAGLAALPASVKFAGAKSMDASELLCWFGKCHFRLLGAEPSDSSGGKEWAVAKATYVDSFDMHGTWRFTADDRVLLEVAADVPRGLRKVAEDCRYYGYAVSARDPKTVIIDSGSGDPLACPVEVTLLPAPGSQAGDEIRFRAPIAALGPIHGAERVRDPEETAMRRVTKRYLWSLLTSNVSSVHHCRLGVDPDTTELVVLVDQLLSTMDRDECIGHLRNVSSIANEFKDKR